MTSVALPFTTAQPRNTGLITHDLDIELLFDDVDNLIDKEAHGAVTLPRKRRTGWTPSCLIFVCASMHKSGMS